MIVGTSEAPRRCEKVSVSSDGIDYISCAQSPYRSLNYHRSMTDTRHPKSLWIESISRADECHYFCMAELGKWVDADGNCWSTSRDATTELGTRGERVGYFDFSSE